jgi:hypothetical protein
MSKKFQYNPVISSYALLNKSYNKLKTKGSLLLNNFRNFLEDDDVKSLLSVSDHRFESFILEIFDLRFFVRIEIDLDAQDNEFKSGRIATYFINYDSELERTKLMFRYDEDSKLYWINNETVRPDFMDMEDFTVEYIRMLIEHIHSCKYTTIPNSTYEGEKEKGWRNW